MFEEVKQRIDEWLVGTVPNTPEQGIEDTKRMLRHEVERVVGCGDVTVEVWQNHDTPTLLRFECTYMNGSELMRVFYDLDTRFWDRLPGTPFLASVDGTRRT